MERLNKLSVYFIIGILVMLMLAAFDKPEGAEAKVPRNLSLGKIGGDVRQLQIDLDKKGYNLEPYDGIYGLKTQQAVIDLQKKNELKRTGVFDTETRKVLREGDKKKPSVNRKDVIVLARAVHGEARGESFEGQVAVAAVILNRTRSEGFPDTIHGVIFQPGAFDAVDDGQIWLKPDHKAMKAAELALSGYDPTGRSIYYWNPAKSTNKWIWSRPITKKIGEHVFAK